ncbi:MAG: AAA family ATPase [Solirubrobacterales bacterium]
MIHLIAAGPDPFIERLREDTQSYQQQIRIVTVVSEPKLAADFLESSPQDYHAVLFGFSNDINQALLETCMRYSTPFKAFVLSTDLPSGFRMWAPFNAQPVLKGNEVIAVLDFFGVGADSEATPGSLPAPEKVAERVEIVRRKTETEAITVRQKVISIFAPMGGVGKTTLAVSMARSMVALSNLKVCLVDLDTSRPFGNVLKYLGFLGDEKASVRHTMVAWRDFPWEKRAVWGEVAGRLVKVNNRLFVLPSIKSLTEASQLSEELITRSIDVLRRHFDLIILDLGNNATDWAITAMELSNELFFVTKLDITDVDDLEAFIHDNLPDIRVSASQLNLVINYTMPGMQFSPHQVAAYLGMSYVAAFPEDNEVRRMLANRGQVPYRGAHDTPFTRELEKVMARVYPLSLFDTPKRKQTLWRRLSSQLNWIREDSYGR